MKTIIISDLHNRVNWIEDILSSLQYDNVIFLGDYFDDFNDTKQDIKKSAIWLKQSLSKPNRVHLMGTHDMWYRFPFNPYLQASGNTNEKCNIINSIINSNDWNKLRLYHFEQNFLMTHAGLHPYLLRRYNFSLDFMKAITDEALADIMNRRMNQWLDAGFARGGRQPFGGLTWLDWDCEFEPISSLNQIVGHTIHKFPQEKHTKNSKNYDLDTRNRHIGILEDENFSWIGNYISNS